MTNLGHKLVILLLFLASVFVAYFSVFSLLPVSWYVNQVSPIERHDVCVGSNRIEVTSERIPRWGMLGETYSEIVRFDGQYRYETNIRRLRADGTLATPRNGANWGYEEGTTQVSYPAVFSAPFEEPGEYGVQSWNKLYPLPLITIHYEVDATEARFNVVDCE